MPINLKLKKNEAKSNGPKNKSLKEKVKGVKLNIKMPTLKLTKRDKYLLASLFVFALVYAAWNFAALPLIAQVDELKAELDAVNQEVFNANLEIAGLEKRREELAELKRIHAEEGKGYFHDFIQEEFMLRISKKIINSGIIEDTVSYQNPNYDTESISALNAGNTAVSLGARGNYEQVMAFLAEIENDPKAMFVESLSLSDGSAGEVSASIVLNIPIFNSPYMTADPAYDFDWDSVKQGKLTPFDSTGILQLPEIDLSALPSQYSPEEAVLPESVPPIPAVPQEQIQAAAEMPEDITDFFLSAMADTADFESAMFGKTGDNTGQSYVSADTNAFADVVLIFDRNAEGKYFYRAEIDGNSSGAVAFVPRSAEINMKVFSMSRYGERDFSGIRVHVENKTDTALNIQVINDDAEAPRVLFTYKSGKVNVENVQ